MNAKPQSRNPGAGETGTDLPGVGGLDDALLDRLEDLDAGAAVGALGVSSPGALPDLDTVQDQFPGPVAERFYWSDGSVVGIQGPVGSGKTTTLLKSRLRRALAMPRSVIDGVRRYKLVATRETYRQLWSSTIPSYLETFPKALGQWSGGRGDPVRHIIEFEDDFGPIEFITEFLAFGDNIVQSMRGIQTTDLWLNESDTLPDEVLAAGIGRINRHPGRAHLEGYPPELRSYGQIACDFNAPDEDNWTFGFFHDEEQRNRLSRELSAGLPEGAKRVSIEFFNQPGYGEPGCENLHNLSPDYYPVQIAANKALGRGDMNTRLVFNKVTYLKAGDPVFKDQFNRRIHVSERPLVPWEGVPLRIGLDQGFKAAAVIAQFDTPFRWQVLGELHFPNERLMAREFGRRLREYLDTHFPGLRVEGGWGDMAGEAGASQAEEDTANWNTLAARAANIRIMPQRIGNNSIQPRLEAVRAPLEYLHGGAPGLVIDPRCRFLIRGFEARYVWAEEVNASGDKRKVPDKSKTEANVMDALQYLLLSKHRADGSSPISHPDQTGLMGHNGGPPLSGDHGGLQTGWDVHAPYGG
jgi:hypothetical protein